MYKHVGSWKLMAQVDGMEKADLALEVDRRVDALPGIISGIRGFEVAVNVVAYTQAGTIAEAIGEYRV
ncbi:hypothetical protein PDESU_00503 [Pontiella desulfatans]|uniref:Uncharacterized protein n=1 Tax=Pontiella desulfatans TaxID=2750659 RepID=A0A6C2TWA3_PONDE|nr:hypothetical protein [Pontiella desulfatans]VGO11955.1 hypothetical protein PDESU_00503 [Pontiella desulfatans]